LSIPGFRQFLSGSQCPPSFDGAIEFTIEFLTTSFDIVCSVARSIVLSFILFVPIGFTPFVSAFFALDSEVQFTKKAVPQILLYAAVAMVTKLFLVSIVLPELQGHDVQTFIVTLAIHSFEFVFFRLGHVAARVNKASRGHTFALCWSALTVFVTSTLTFVSNSRMQELEAHHVAHALS